MGLTDSVYFLSWFLNYFVLNLLFSFVNTIIIKFVFNFIGFFYVFILFFLYGMCIFSLAYFFQSFLDKSRIATIISIVGYFLMYLLNIVALSEYMANWVKVLFSIFPPSSLQYGLNVLLQYEVYNITEFNVF